MTILKTRFLASLAFVAALLVGSAEAADHVDAGGTAVVEWSLNEAGLYEIDVTLQ